MSNLQIGLIVSIPVALIIMLVAWLITRNKINKIKKKYMKKNPSLNTIRPESGELLWDLKNETKNPINDFVLDYALATTFNNKYKNLYVENDSYIEENFKHFLKDVEFKDKNLNFALLEFNDQYKKKINSVYSNMKISSILMFYNVNKNKKIFKIFKKEF
ncbi:MAG: hypothetical protein K4H23_05285, partial [Mollicutes bacterium PWAP]|nr:hypothetical protein [Mollicutes bacterium PWAP]